METVIYFTTGYGKRVEMKISKDKYDELSIVYVDINGTLYKAKHIRTAVRENMLLNYASNRVDIVKAFSNEESVNQ